jgi:hypothetical protein
VAHDADAGTVDFAKKVLRSIVVSVVKRERQRQTDKGRDKERERYTDRQRGGQRERERYRPTEGGRKRNGERFRPTEGGRKRKRGWGGGEGESTANHRGDRTSSGPSW